MSEFIIGSLEDVKKYVDIAELDDDYKSPTETLPIPPPPQYNQNDCGKCKSHYAIVHGKLDLILLQTIFFFDQTFTSVLEASSNMNRENLSIRIKTLSISTNLSLAA